MALDRTKNPSDTLVMMFPTSTCKRIPSEQGSTQSCAEFIVNDGSFHKIHIFYSIKTFSKYIQQRQLLELYRENFCEPKIINLVSSMLAQN